MDSRALGVPADTAAHVGATGRGQGAARPRGVFIGRSEELDGVSAALRDPARLGALLLGGAGIGKTVLALEAVQAVQETHHIVHVRGSAVSSKLPYGALGYLLSELPERALEHPVLAYQGLARLLRRKAAGRAVLLLVDNAHELDAMSVTAVIQLALSGQARLLVLARGLTGAAEEFVQLWSDGRLKRFDLAAFTPEEAETFASCLLGGMVSRSAAEELWAQTAGSPLYLRLLVREQREAGSLVLQDGVWDLVAPVVRSGEIADVVRAQVARLHPGQRRIIELLAFAGELPLEVLLRLSDPFELDRLEEDGHLRVLPSIPPVVQLNQRLMAEVVRESVPPARSRQLWEALAAVVSDVEIPAGTLLGFAAWSIACGVPLAAPTALRAARRARHLQDPATALRFVRSVPGYGLDPELVLEEASALHALGRLDEAAAVLEAAQPRAVADLRLWVRLGVERHRVLRRLPGRGREAADAVVAIRRAVAAAPGNNDGGAALAWEAVLLEAEFAAFEGRHAQFPRELEDLYGNESLPLGMRLYAGCLLAEAWALTGRCGDALAIVAWLEAGAGNPSLSPSMRDTVLVRIFEVLLASGQWRRCRELLAPQRSAGRVGAARGTAGELAAGLLHAACGHPDEALELLLPALAKLKRRDPAGTAPLALAAAAYASALQGDAGRAERCLHELECSEQELAWSIRSWTRYFEVLARAALAGFGVVGERPRQAKATEAAGAGRFTATLLAEAEHASRLGLPASSGAFLTAAARLGDAEAVARLLAEGPRDCGPAGELGELFAAGLVGNDGAALLQAARLASAEGNDLFACEAAGAAQLFAADQLAARQARELANSSFRRLRPEHGLRRRFAMLGRFEQELTVAAAGGKSSSELAKELNLSPRTIDWHLGKIYVKLHVSSRAELAELLT
ncbi:helix-turn-helix transcriptional regulator [Arthrobacter sp. Marseille-P9274]|uniref:helix-turn-helix transcriptional regulator n=1 Tax=Arthrobacter sp. Marseille-P9274 TaxID=2866572 RepID=UPI0021C5E5C2|nr:helix-turn-helix transcriptional regulator [Arthrobacter sp. Marseille-P9274]